MNKPVIKSTTDVAVMLHNKGLEVNKWNHIAIRFGLRDTFRVYVNEPMKGNIIIELVRVCGLYEQQHEKQIGTYNRRKAVVGQPTGTGKVRNGG